MGELSVYHGCMFAGKTRLLIMKLSKKKDLGFSTIYVTHSCDERDMTSHSTYFSHFPFELHRAPKLDLDLLKKYDVIGIDEFQFFSRGDVNTVKVLVDLYKKIVYCVGLDSDFRREKFGYILDLLPFATKSRKIRAKCEWCRQENKLIPACFTAKINGDLNCIKEIGAEDKYLPLCRWHYLNYYP